ncbi:MAG: hypothetical protein KME08_17980 [Aphanothece sp. CMT-3BRIN-NPC111]|jgi:hypothetical protein|nr:hypothetical protein [Aphanothece sp. CMT-3BRIN-NPC111]
MVVFLAMPTVAKEGDRPLTRYVFAAVLNAYLQPVNQRSQARTAETVSKEDLGKLQRLPT